VTKRLAILLAMLAGIGCRTSGNGGGSRAVIVNAFAGDQPEPGVTVIGHAPDGDIIDQTTADAVGRAEVGVDDSALVSVVFPGNLGALTPVVSLVTLPAPDASGPELAVHGPAHVPAPLIVGTLTVDGPNLAGASYFDIRIGCATVRATQLPFSFDVGACSMGSDAQLDVLVAGYHDVGGDPPAPALDGYAAARVAMTGGVATFDVPAWQTTRPSVPVSLAGVAPFAELELFSDGLSFGSQPLTDHGSSWTGLVVDAARVTAALAGTGTARVTTRELAGAPAAIQLAASDFLPPIEITAALTRLVPTSLRWDAAGLGDAVNLHVTWQVAGALAAVPTGPHRVIWDAVLPPDATSVTLPAFDDELAAAIAPTAIEPVDVLVRYVDSDELDGFDALIAAGVHAEDTVQASTIAPRPRQGQLRTSHAIGLR
jgi:hypothetical protein